MIPWIQANAGLLTIAYLITIYFAAWHCLNFEQGTDRLTWLFAIITLPIGGVIFYAMHEWTKPIQEDTNKSGSDKV